jgi:hypothetical protein
LLIEEADRTDLKKQLEQTARTGAQALQLRALSDPKDMHKTRGCINCKKKLKRTGTDNGHYTSCKELKSTVTFLGSSIANYVCK